MGTNQQTLETEPDRLRWYTRARRIPKLIGKTANGGALIGGPYTVTQFVGGAITLLGLNLTRSLWGGNGLGDYLVIAAMVAVAVFALKFVRSAGRNPALVLAGRAAGAISPSYGRQGGAPVRTPRGQRLSSTVNVDLTPARRTPTPTPALSLAALDNPVALDNAEAVENPGARGSARRHRRHPARQPLTARIRSATTRTLDPALNLAVPDNVAPRVGGRTRLEQLVAAATAEGTPL